MITTYKNRIFLLLLIGLCSHGCIEPYEFEAETYEDVLVLEADITDEFGVQEVLLSRSFRLGGEAPVPETGASVHITDDQNNLYLFYEAEPGKYRSREPFQAVSNRRYQLEISTPDGELYLSDPTTLAESSEMDDLYVRRTTFRGEDGLALQVDNRNAAEDARYFRYKFEETYKITSRFSHNYDLVYIDGQFVEVRKTKEETICYNTVVSNDIILAATTSLQENSLQGFLVRFIDSDDPITSRRYSILVKQYALSPEAFAYYETLKKLSGQDNVFSQSQPGFVAGNVYNPANPQEKVVGMFNVSSLSTERIFFNYGDFYGPDDDRPYFTEDCEVGSPSITPPPRADNLIAMLQSGRVKYIGKTEDQGEDGGPYRVVNAECVDCTLLGTNIEPEFWEEE